MEWKDAKNEKIFHPRPVSIVEIHPAVELSFTPDSRWLITDGMGDWIDLYQVPSFEHTATLSILPSEVRLPTKERRMELRVGLTVSPDGKWLASIAVPPTMPDSLPSKPVSIFLWSLSPKDVQKEYISRIKWEILRKESELKKIAFTHDGKSLAVLYAHELHFVEPETGVILHQIPLNSQASWEDSASDFVFSKDGKQVFVGIERRKSLRLYDTRSGVLKWTVRVPDSETSYGISSSTSVLTENGWH